ncbi:uncharacterized protein C15orf39 homolog [Notolabrus celidotus]|uniref:uncharacterized protein C15orf39 homolog n=1 Tax=Notolabrus celidotus TaxID=1203425 RepID=UPI0014907BDC|nr:uncharacterized protein C15orf39 homolog [Notolabrus celidotus]
MMSSQSVQSPIGPFLGRKMPLYDGTRLAKAKMMSDLQGIPTLQYSGAYFTYDPKGKEAVGFTPPWSNSKTSLLVDRNPVSHLSGMEGQNHIFYRQDSKSSDEGHSSPLHHAAVKQGFKQYAKSPGLSSPVTATAKAGRKQKSGGETLSPPAENPVYLAIPKPVYGLNPCCNELGCVIGHRYSMEHGPLRIPNPVYEHELMQTDAHHAERGKAQDALLQQRGLQLEPGAEALKRMTVGPYSPSRVRTLPAMMDPNCHSYPCTLPHTVFGSLSEQSQRLQTSPRVFPSFYPSHPTYEHMTSEVYQEHSPMSKYGQLTQHPMFYYPQANVEVENRTPCKDIGSKQREGVPVIVKHKISNHREHYMVPQLFHGEIPLRLSDETLHHHAFMRSLEQPPYAASRFHPNPSHLREILNSNRGNGSQPSHYLDLTMQPAPSVHKDKPSPSLSQTNLPFLHVDQNSPPRHISQPSISPNNHVNRFFPPPLTSLHLNRPVLPATSLNMDRLQDYSSFEAQVRSPMQAEGLPVSPGAWLPHSLYHKSGQIHSALPGGASVPILISSPAVAPGKNDSPMPRSGSASSKGCLKRSISHSSSPEKIKVEDRELYEVEHFKKRQKMKMESVIQKDKTDSPPMPVIDNVFSLAPYQAYLQAPGLLFPGRVSQRTAQSSELREVKSKPDIKEKKPCRDEQQPVVCLVSKEIDSDTPADRHHPETSELKNVKVEKVDPSNTDHSGKTCIIPKDFSAVKIKKEYEDNVSSNRVPMLVIKKVDPDEFESKPLREVQNETSNEPKLCKETAKVDASPLSDTSVRQPTPSTPPQTPENRLKFKNIPPQCLKLSKYNIIFNGTNHSRPVLPPEQTSVILKTEFVPALEPLTPVRQHFFELHQSLCKLLSKSVLASSEQDLKTWLSHLELTEPASPTTKVKKVSCLLGIEAREVWLNEELKLALQKLQERLREYTAQERCPFPHVMRTGAVFLPMLVVKELLFPTVQGSLIDQVLQEHKVKLRPTTLSEEKILIQLHKRACSSRLRRLMSLKHLPDIYADVVNLMYYTCVCKHLGLDMDNPANTEKDEGFEETITCEKAVTSDIMASPASPEESHPQRHPNDQGTSMNRNRMKGRVRTMSKRLFLDNSLSEEEEAADTEKTVKRIALNVVAEEESSIPLSSTSENSWTCPLTLDELSPSQSDTEVSSSPDIPCWGPAKPPVRSKNCSGVILRLRRMFSKDLNRKNACYQTISDPENSQAPDWSREMSSEMEIHRRTPKITHRWQRTGNFCHALRPLSSSSKRKHRSFLKIKYCPYLSACHSAENRRRWVLRSAVQTARRAMRIYYPDLVGKRIRHLYEEDDKSEVWYIGEVLRIHEAHTNPLKTIFEVRYDSEPEWKYYLELLMDYKKGWLKIEE